MLVLVAVRTDVGVRVELSADDLQRAMDARSRTQTRTIEAAAAYARDTLDRLRLRGRHAAGGSPSRKYRVTPAVHRSTLRGACAVLPPPRRARRDRAAARGVEGEAQASQVAAAGVLGWAHGRSSALSSCPMPLGAFLKANWGR